MTGVEVRAWSGVVLLGALLGEACARAKPPPAAAPVEPGEDLAALKAAKAADRCVDAVVPLRQTDGDIVEVGLGVDAVYGMTRAGLLRAWDMRGSAVTVLEGTRWRALSPDGSTALSSRPEAKGLTLVAWDLRSRRPLRELPLPDGLSNHPPLAVSGSTAIVSEVSPPCGDECDCDACQPSPDEPVVWDLASGKTSPLGLSCGPIRALSRDGRALVCRFSEHGDEQVLHWGDLAHGNGFLPTLAPEWPRKYEGDDDPSCLAFICRAGRMVVSPLRITSMQFPPEGGAVVYTYYGLSLAPLSEKGTPQHGWRLERLTADGSAKGAGRVDRLAQSPDTLCAKLLAVSAAGGLAVLGGEVVHASVRRAALRCRAARPGRGGARGGPLPRRCPHPDRPSRRPSPAVGRPHAGAHRDVRLNGALS